MSSREPDSAFSADTEEVPRGSGNSDAAENESGARLCATANNARLSLVALAFATVHVRWLA